MKDSRDEWTVFKDLGINPVDIMRELAQIDEEAERKQRRWRRERFILWSILVAYTAYTVWRVLA